MKRRAPRSRAWRCTCLTELSRFLQLNSDEVVIFHHSLRISADLFVDSNHDLAHADAINSSIPISRALCRAKRDIEDRTRAFEEVVVNRLPMRRALMRSIEGRIENGFDLISGASMLPDIPAAAPELFGKDNGFHRYPFGTRNTMLTPQPTQLF